MKFNLRNIIKLMLVAVLAFGVLAPPDADAARKRSRKKATTTATVKKKSKTTRKKSRRRASSQTVTQETQAVARQASESHASAASKPNSAAKKEGNLRKITVDKPDLEAIRVATLDPHNKFYYPKLMAKYQKNDTTMTSEEYRYLYLGYMFQEDYDPYRVSPYASMTDDLRLKAEHTKDETDTIKKYTEKALLDNPFDLRQMSFLVHVLKEKRKGMSAKIWEYRLEHLLEAIKSTGTGEDIENAWYVIYPMHEYDIIQLMGYEATDVDYIEPGFDFLSVVEDGTQKHRQQATGFYFNVQVPQQQYDLKHPGEQDELLGADGDDGDDEISVFDPDEVAAE